MKKHYSNLRDEVEKASIGATALGLAVMLTTYGFAGYGVYSLYKKKKGKGKK